jgi:hypothetical protein
MFNAFLYFSASFSTQFFTAANSPHHGNLNILQKVTPVFLQTLGINMTEFVLKHLTKITQNKDDQSAVP